VATTSPYDPTGTVFGKGRLEHLASTHKFMSDIRAAMEADGYEWTEELRQHIRKRMQESQTPAIETGPFKGEGSPLAQFLAGKQQRQAELAKQPLRILDDLDPPKDAKPGTYDPEWKAWSALKMEQTGLTTPPQDRFLNAIGRRMTGLESQETRPLPGTDPVEEFVGDWAHQAGDVAGMVAPIATGQSLIKSGLKGLIGRKAAEHVSGPLAFGAYEGIASGGDPGAAAKGLGLGTLLKAQRLLPPAVAGKAMGPTAKRAVENIQATRPYQYGESAALGAGLTALDPNATLRDVALGALSFPVVHGMSEGLTRGPKAPMTPRSVEKIRQAGEMRTEMERVAKEAGTTLKDVMEKTQLRPEEYEAPKPTEKRGPAFIKERLGEQQELPLPKKPKDVQVGAGIDGATPEQVGKARDMALRGLAEGTLGVPARIINKVVAEPIKAAGRALGRKINNLEAGEHINHARRVARSLTSISRAPEEVVREYRKFVGKTKVTAHEAQELFIAPQRAAEKVIRKSYKKKRGKEALRGDRQTPLLSALYQYSKPDAAGNRPGLKTWAKWAEHKDFPKEWRWLDKEMRKILGNQEKYKDVLEYLDTYRDIYEEMKRIKEDAGWYDAPLGEFGEGISYLPEHDVVRLKGKKGMRKVWLKPGKTGDLATTHPSQAKKRHRDGLAERLAKGHTWRDFDLINITAREYNDVQRVMAAQEMRTKLLDTVVMDRATGESVPAALWSDTPTFKKKVDQATYTAIEAPGFKRVRNWSKAIEAEGVSPVPERFQKYLVSDGKLMVHRDIAPVLENYLDKGISNKFIKPIFNINAKMKVAKLSLSPFHYWALWMNNVGLGANPFPKAGGKGLFAKLTKQKISDNILLDPIVTEGMAKGQFTLTPPDIAHIRTGMERIVKEMGHRRKFSPLRAVGGIERFNSYHLWENTYRATKAAAFKAVYNQLRNINVGHEQALKDAGTTVNRLHGGIDWEWKGIARSAKQVASMVLLAPDWQISNWSFWLQGLRDPGAKGQVARMGMARIAALNFVAGNMMNKMLSGHWMHENEEGKRHLVQFSLPDNWPQDAGQTMYFDPWRHWGEQWKVALGFWNELTPDQLEIAEARDPAPYMVGKIAALPRFGVEATSGMEFKSGRGLARLADIKEGKTSGPYGRPQWGIDPWLIAYLRAWSPISAESMMKAVGDDKKQFFSDPQVWSGMTGWHFSKDYGEKSSRAAPATGRRRSRRSSGGRRGSRR